MGVAEAAVAAAAGAGNPMSIAPEPATPQVQQCIIAKQRGATHR